MSDRELIKNGGMVGVYCYVGGVLFPAIYLTSEPYKSDPFIRFHCFQSIILTLIFIALKIGSYLGIIPSLLSTVILMVWGVTWITLMIFAYRGRSLKLPIIGYFAEQRAMVQR